MATPAATGVKIWACTMFFNGVIIGITSMFTPDFHNRMIAVAFIAGGFIVTSPLIFLIIQLLKLPAQIPYGIAARKVWLWFILSALIFLFFLLFSWISGRTFLGRPLNIYRLTGIAMLALFIAMLCLPQSIREICTQQSKKISL